MVSTVLRRKGEPHVGILHLPPLPQYLCMGEWRQTDQESQCIGAAHRLDHCIFQSRYSISPLKAYGAKADRIEG